MNIDHQLERTRSSPGAGFVGLMRLLVILVSSSNGIKTVNKEAHQRKRNIRNKESLSFKYHKPLVYFAIPNPINQSFPCTTWSLPASCFRSRTWGHPKIRG